MKLPDKFALEIKDNGNIIFRGIIEHPPIHIGRGKDCDIPLEKYDFLSRKHLEIFFDHGNFHFKDSGSSNGIYINKKRVKEGAIEDGLEINIGDLTLAFKVVANKPLNPEPKKETTEVEKTITEISLHGTLSEAIQLEVMYEDLKEDLGTDAGIKLREDTGTD